MSESVEDAEPIVCRLCTSTKPGQLQIFSKEGEKRQLWKKIKECLPFQVHQEDVLTTSLCDICVSKVEDFHEFQQKCVQAQVLLEESNHQLQMKVEINEKSSAEAEELVERLQAGAVGSALSITPILTPQRSSPVDINMFNSSGALSITPVTRNSESSGDDDSQWGNPTTITLPRLKDPRSEDYILMQEETFKLDCARQTSKFDVVEYFKRQENGALSKDRDILDLQSLCRVVLPPMWDVFEKSADKENMVHRRYVISKSSFPCSLCGACVAFHRQQVLQQKNQEHLHQQRQEHEKFVQDEQLQLQQLIESPFVKQEPQEDLGITLQDQQSDLEQQIMKDLRVTQFPSQEVGMLDCPECGKLFPRRSSWKRHLRTHYEGRAFICPLCGKGFNRKEHLSRHMMSHTGGRPFRCDTCFKPFTRKEHLARHLACNTGCGGTFGLSSENDSGVPRPYTCDICYQGFVRKEHMLRHRKRAHLLMDGYVAPVPGIEEEDGRPFSCGICCKSFGRKEHLNRHQQVHMREMALSVGSSTESNLTPPNPIHTANPMEEDEASDGPEQIEVEVNLNLLERESGQESEDDGGELSQQGQVNGTQFITTPTETDPDGEEVEMDQEDLLRMQMNEAMRQAREGTSSSNNQAPRCEVCQKSFTRKSHLVRHLRRFHPHVELAYAAAYSLGNVVDSAASLETSQAQLLASAQSSQLRDEASTTGGEDDADDESGASLPLNDSLSVLRSKGGQHPCSICGKMFGRRYHLVRHRRTQHGVESVEAGRVGRPPKRLSLLAQQCSIAKAKPFRCSACGGQFVSHNDFQAHSCNSNNNIISTKSGSTTVAEMAAKVSDKLLKGKDKISYDCESCGQSFSKQCELSKHVETHVSDLMEGMLWT